MPSKYQDKRCEVVDKLLHYLDDPKYWTTKAQGEIEETCFLCHDYTGHSGRRDDSIYDSDGNGPYCEECYETRRQDRETLWKEKKHDHETGSRDHQLHSGPQDDGPPYAMGSATCMAGSDAWINELLAAIEDLKARLKILERRCNNWIGD